MELKVSRVEAVKQQAPEMHSGSLGAAQVNVSGQDQVVTAEFILDLLTVEEIAAALRVFPSWVYERVRRRDKDKMPHVKVGKYLRFRLNEVRTWIDQGGAR